ncbi:hypothetical protein VM57_01690 [Stenotrophomonas maltophilia]|uniref:Uncharacterized protein n=1 Tax=Stenotrophomonas maltophilia TaxID=40324 RepID=A0A0F5ZPL1_STEMA|nr:hypothetical protein VM57_01690 [Stenotrophomonas maltophilia]
MLIADRQTLEKKMLKAEMHPFWAGLTGNSEREGWMAAAGTRPDPDLVERDWMDELLGNPLASYWLALRLRLVRIPTSSVARRSWQVFLTSYCLSA